MIRDTNNSADDEFGFNYISEVEFNKRHKKALKKADSSYKEKKGWVKIADGVYQNLAKLRAEEKPKKKKKKKEKHNWFKGLGSSNRTNRGPLGNKE